MHPLYCTNPLSHYLHTLQAKNDMCEPTWKMTLVMIEHMQSGKGIYNKDEYNLKHILLELCTHTRVIGKGSPTWKMLGLLMNEDTKSLNWTFMMTHKLPVYSSQFWVILS